jgi:hypothetical protein
VFSIKSSKVFRSYLVFRPLVTVSTKFGKVNETKPYL